MNNKNIFIVIPAYNEAKVIVNVISEIKKNYSNIIVIDDCSNDSTYEAAKSTGIYVVKHIINRGQGAALQTGITYSLKQGADVIVTFDADGQHDPNDIKKMIEPIINEKCDITLGSRFLDGRINIPYTRKIVLKLAVIFTKLVSRISVTDTHNGFRALSRVAAEKIEIKQDRMSHASEILDQIPKLKIKYMEIPIEIKYTEYSIQKGQSSMNAIRIAWDFIKNKVIK